jgi:hypothetical protein
MYSYFSDLHVQLVARGLMAPGERLIGQTVTESNPWWALGLLRKTYLILATDRRIVVMEHRVVWMHQAARLDSVESYPWANVQELKLKGIFAKKLRLVAQGDRGPKRLTMKVPNALFGLLAPMRNNMAGARKVATAREGLPALPSAQASTASAAYGAPFNAGYPAPALGAPNHAPPPQA